MLIKGLGESLNKSHLDIGELIAQKEDLVNKCWNLEYQASRLQEKINNQQTSLNKVENYNDVVAKNLELGTELESIKQELKTSFIKNEELITANEILKNE